MPPSLRAIRRSRAQARNALNRPVLPEVEVRQESRETPRESERRELPVIVASRPVNFRVLRPVFTVDGSDATYELLAECQYEEVAVALCKIEKWRAIVSNGRTNKMVFANGGVVKRRSE